MPTPAALQDPVTLAEYGLGAAALYVLGPALLGGLAGGLRGYAGELTAVQVTPRLRSSVDAPPWGIRQGWPSRRRMRARCLLPTEQTPQLTCPLPPPPPNRPWTPSTTTATHC
jgi:hypothetical protein